MFDHNSIVAENSVEEIMCPSSTTLIMYLHNPSHSSTNEFSKDWNYGMVCEAVAPSHIIPSTLLSASIELQSNIGLW